MMMLAILLPLKTMESLKNEVATHFRATPLFSMRTISLGSSKHCRRVDAEAWCKRDVIDILLATGIYMLQKCLGNTNPCVQCIFILEFHFNDNIQQESIQVRCVLAACQPYVSRWPPVDAKGSDDH